MAVDAKLLSNVTFTGGYVSEFIKGVKDAESAVLRLPNDKSSFSLIVASFKIKTLMAFGITVYDHF